VNPATNAVERKALSSRAREIVGVALELLEQEGAAGLTMRRLGERLGIKAPSIYKHFPDKDALESAIISVGFELQADAFERAVEGAEDPLQSIGRAYREFARARPHLYRLITERELNRALLEPGAEDRAARPLVEALGGDIDVARAVWAFAHGMTILELDRRFPADADLDAAWERGQDAFRPTRKAKGRS
jgi:AcrR family transcriptional regulator